MTVAATLESFTPPVWPVLTVAGDRHDAADKVDLVPRSDSTVTVLPATTPASSSPPPTTDTDPLHAEGRSNEVVPVEHPYPLPRSERLSVRVGGGATDQGLERQCYELLSEAVNIARRLPPRLIVHLSSPRMVEVALGSCITTGLNTEIFLAAAGVVLSWARDLPVALDPLFTTHGTNTAAALTEVRTTLELLSGLDPPRH